jgi:cytochrome c oxidase subunit 1
MFMLGGFSGIMHSAAPADAQQQDSYFVIAHFHYVLLGGILMGLLSGIYFWIPKIFGKQMHEKLGYIAAGLIIIGFNVTFFPMHYLGLTGMPRRTHTYLGDMGWDFWNAFATGGAMLLGIGVVIVFADVVVTICSKARRCSNDVWDGRTLEWSLTSPVQEFNFARIPVIAARDAFWEHKHGNKEIGAVPGDSHGIHMPSQSWWPLLSGCGFIVFGIGMSMMSAGVPLMGYVSIIGLVIVTLSIYLWALEGPGGYHLKVPEAIGSANTQPSSQSAQA